MPKAVFEQLGGFEPSVPLFVDGNSQFCALFETQTFQKGRFFVEQYSQSFERWFGGLDDHGPALFFFQKQIKKLKGVRNMMQAIFGNAAHPEYGVATIPFPIPRAENANCVALLEALEIGNARDRDCQVQEIRGPGLA